MKNSIREQILHPEFSKTFNFRRNEGEREFKFLLNSGWRICSWIQFSLNLTLKNIGLFRRSWSSFIPISSVKCFARDVCALLAEKYSKGTSLNFFAKLLPGETLCKFFQIFPPKDLIYIRRKSFSHLFIN